MILIEKLSPIIPKGNPFDFDLFRMGTKVNEKFIAMYGIDENDIILVHNDTGQRLRVKFDNDRESQVVLEKHQGLRQEYSSLAMMVNEAKKQQGD